MAKEESTARDLMIQNFKNDMEKITHHIEQLLPFKGGVQKFVEMANLAILRDPKLLECSRKSLLLAIIWCAQQNLEPGVEDGAWLIPFKGIVVPVPAYKGLIKRAAETESVHDVQPFPVFANDTFEYGLGLNPYIDHKPPKLGAARGELIGVYVIITMPDMSKRFWVMDRADVEAIRNSSAAYKAKPNEGPWHDWFDKMAMKTVIKQGLKYIPVKAPLRDLLYDDNKLEAGESVATLLRQSGAELDDLVVEEPEVPKPDTSAFDNLIAGKNLGTVQKKHLELFLEGTAAGQKKVNISVAQLKAATAKSVLQDGKLVSNFVMKPDGTIWDKFLEWETTNYPKPKKEKEEPATGAAPAGEPAGHAPSQEPVLKPEIVGGKSGEGEGTPPEDDWGTPKPTFMQEKGDIWNAIIQKAIPLKDLMDKVAVKNLADITPENIASVKAFVSSWEKPRKGKK